MQWALSIRITIHEHASLQLSNRFDGSTLNLYHVDRLTVVLARKQYYPVPSDIMNGTAILSESSVDQHSVPIDLLLNDELFRY